MKKLILASKSLARKQILQQACYNFQVKPSNYNEVLIIINASNVYDSISHLALEKAKSTIAHNSLDKEPCFVIGVDTVIRIKDKIIKKPCDINEAKLTLSLLSGQIHEVISGIAVVLTSPYYQHAEVATSRVKFKTLTSKQIKNYLATGESIGKAGSYAIQGYASRFIEWIDGCFFNVVGIPISRLDNILTKLGFYE